MADTIVLWAEGGELVPYEKEKHVESVFKFLYWEEGKTGVPVAVAGGINYMHSDLLYLASTDTAGSVKRPIGAGTCKIGTGKVRIWESVGLEVITPDELRPIISEALGIS